MSVFTPAQALAEGYLSPRVLPTGETAAVLRNLFTFGLVVLEKYGPAKRWCYESPVEALLALATWDGQGDPPGPWIKQKLPVERLNPNWSKS